VGDNEDFDLVKYLIFTRYVAMLVKRDAKSMVVVKHELIVFERYYY